MGDPVNAIADWLKSILQGWNLNPGLVGVILAFLGIIILSVFVLIIDIFLVWVERKVVARFQDRLGPNRVGPYGLIQPIADVIKLLIKEDITPKGADKFIYNLSPIIALATVLILWAVIPFAPTIIGSEINVGALFIVAIGAISTLGVIMAGWASNNKYALLGAFRTVAQMISYEIPMVIALLIPVILSSSMGMNTIVEHQKIWFIMVAPLAALIFLISSIAEIGRSPFDLVEAESEIVAGFHIEYTGIKFGLFYAGELLHALTVSAIFSTLFLGGWRGPLATTYPILGIFYLFAKSFLIYFVIMWLRYTVPRIRIDHMLGFNWKFLTPLALLVLIGTALLDKILKLNQISSVYYLIVMMLFNVVIFIGTTILLRNLGKRERPKVADEKPVASPDNHQVTYTASN